MANTYDTLRGRSRTQTVGVSEKMVRLRDMVIANSPPSLSVPTVPSMSCDLYVLSPAESIIYNGSQMGILSWNNGSIYKTSNLMNSFRQRYRTNYLLDATQHIGG